MQVANGFILKTLLFWECNSVRIGQNIQNEVSVERSIFVDVVAYQLIEYVPGGHIGGVKQYNYFPLGKSFILMQKYFYCLLLQHGRRAQTLLAQTES